MSASADNESEILLGNKQLLAIFAVVAFLLAVAFTGGYMLGKNSPEKRPENVTADARTNTATSDTSSGGAITQKITPEEPPVTKTEPKVVQKPPVTTTKPSVTIVPPVTQPVTQSMPPPAKPLVTTKPIPPPAPVTQGLEIKPKPGDTFVQVVALTRTQAEAAADVLRKQNFPAHIAPAPGSAVLFRVLVGPTKDAGDLTSTRDALRKIGFREVLIRHY
jgi:cytoskeletal protein RodZ